jgi:hypothetical protein
MSLLPPAAAHLYSLTLLTGPLPSLDPDTDALFSHLSSGTRLKSIISACLLAAAGRSRRQACIHHGRLVVLPQNFWSTSAHHHLPSSFARLVFDVFAAAYWRSLRRCALFRIRVPAQRPRCIRGVRYLHSGILFS